MSTIRHALSVKRADDFAQWYQEVISAADLAEESGVRGCMVIKPWGYGIWERIQRLMDDRIKAAGVSNCYFPIFIPLANFEREASHVEGFAKEMAVVTHHRLIGDGKGGLIPDPEAKLEEPLVVRPTSETIIGDAMARWIQSWRDLPLLTNQWANVVRWEMRTRMFLRTSEFLWQEGHTAHETEAEALEETDRMLGVYATFARDYLAIPVITGEKTESERFPGAVKTLCIEAMVQDRKAIQAGTSHFLGQNFAKASGIQFQGRDGQLQHAWTTSWGVSTRLIGTMIMAHADDNGLIIPPRVSPAHVVILPVTPKPETREAVLQAARDLAAHLRTQTYHGEPVRVEVDDRDIGGGTKSWEWIKRGAPIRLELGPRDLESGNVALARRDRGPKDREFVPQAEVASRVPVILDEIQSALLERATAFRDAQTKVINSRDEFYAFFTPKNPAKPEIHGGFALAHWNGSPEVEAKIKADLKVTIRCIPFEENPEPGTCIFTGEPSRQRVVFAKSY